MIALLEPSSWRRFALSLVALTLPAWLLAGSASAQEQSRWELNRGNCGEILSSPEIYTLDQVRQCVQRWETYGDADAISRSEAQAYARGFSRLHHQGRSSDQTLANTALSRLGLQVLPPGDFIPDERLDAFLNRSRATIPVAEASSRDARRARDRNTAGMRHYNRGDFRAAADEFRAALDIDPFYLLAKYNLACQLALLGDHDEAIRHLDELSRWDSPAANEKVFDARTDSDFDSMRDDVRFRLLTGAVRVQVLNGAGTPGVPRAREIKSELEEEGYEVVSFGHDRYTRARPTVWHARGFTEVARDVARRLGDDTETRPIDWPADYDLVVVWGSVAEGSALAAPIVQGYVHFESGDPEGALDDTVDTLEDVESTVDDPAGAAEEWEPPF